MSEQMKIQAETWRAQQIARGDSDAAGMSVEDCWLEADTEWINGRAVPGKFSREMSRKAA